MRLVQSKDFIDITRWRAERGVPILSLDFYSMHGLIVDNVAAGFLTRTDTTVAFMENFITNPKAYKADREKAVLDILHELEKDATKQGFKYIVGITNHPKIEEYAKLIGGTVLDYKMYGKELLWA